MGRSSMQKYEFLAGKKEHFSKLVRPKAKEQGHDEEENFK